MNKKAIAFHEKFGWFATVFIKQSLPNVVRERGNHMQKEIKICHI